MILIAWAIAALQILQGGFFIYFFWGVDLLRGLLWLDAPSGAVGLCVEVGDASGLYLVVFYKDDWAGSRFRKLRCSASVSFRED